MNKIELRTKSKEQRVKKYIVVVAFLLFASGIKINAQTSADSLSLNDIIKQIVENHPSVKEAEEALNIADAKIGLAKAGYLPYIDVSGSYTRIAPVPSFPMGELIGGMANIFTVNPGANQIISKLESQNISMAPANNYNLGLNFNQPIYNFGKTKRDINLANENKELSKLSIEQLKQKMSVAAIANFYILLYIQEAIDIKEEELKTLNSHLEFIKKKTETGSGTQYEILSTQVRISNIESQKIDLESGKKVQSSILGALLGKTGRTDLKVKKNLETKLPEVMPDSLISFAFAHRNEMKIAREKTSTAELQYKVTQAQNNPSLNLFATGGIKNGYLPDLNKLTPNVAVGIGLKVPIFEGNRNKNSLLISKSNIQDCNYDEDIAGRNISTEVVQSNADITGSEKKIKQFELQLKQAEKALNLAEINFKSGVITNLDLLDATTSVSESQLLLLKSKIDYIANVYKLKNAIGERLY